MLEYQLICNAASDCRLIDCASCLSALRSIKDEHELSLMKKAVTIAQDALKAMLPLVKIGVSERDLANELVLQLSRHGSDPALPFSPIVSSGPNCANPHATPSERTIAAGDLLLIDWGARFHGYSSDLTRTFAIGTIETEFNTIYQAVREANRAGRQAGTPGTPCSTVDNAARAAIQTAGYGRYFTHRTGHGIGMECHEEPYIRGDNKQLLATGMTFTVEPGIYLAGRGGVRIEDDVIITSDGTESLSDYPRNLQTLC
jgi:Xaa-Pro dipeptidase